MKKKISIAMLLGVCLAITTVYAATYPQNETVAVNLTIANEPPTVPVVELQDSIILTEASTTQVDCTGVVRDRNGQDDIVGINATIWVNDGNTQLGFPDDDNNHYTNASCASAQQGAYNRTFTCTVYMNYNAKNHSDWRCTVFVIDNDADTGTGEDSGNTVEALYAMDAENAIRFGERNLSQVVDEGDSIPLLITNTGNMLIDTVVYGQDKSGNRNNAMNCSTGTIPIGNIGLNAITAGNFTEATKLTSGVVTIDMNVAVREVGPTTETEGYFHTSLYQRNQYWVLRVPDVGVEGYCEGDVIIGAYPS